MRYWDTACVIYDTGRSCFWQGLSELLRFFAHRALACGSVVLIFLMDRFSPSGAKTIHKEFEMMGKQKPLPEERC
jgi:hypothetical protein